MTQCLVKVEMSAAGKPGDVGLDTLKATTITQINRRTLPSLTLGTNQVMLFADEQLETTELWPALHAGAYRKTAAAEDSVFSDKEPDGMYKATLGAGANGRECSVAWRMAVPTDIADVTYGVISTNRSPQSYVSLQHSWDGRSFREFDHNAGDGFAFDKQVIHGFQGGEVPAGAREAHFRGVFFCKNGAATYNMPGIQDLLILVHHKPRPTNLRSVPGFRPIEVAYNWTEHRETGDVTRSHTELVAAMPHRYTVNVAGKRDPTMNWVRINQQGFGPEGKTARYGYSDRVDVGPGHGYPKVTYRWGKQLALGKPYTAGRPSSTASGNRDSDGRELTNGIVIAPTDETGTARSSRRRPSGIRASRSLWSSTLGSGKAWGRAGVYAPAQRAVLPSEEHRGGRLRGRKCLAACRDHPARRPVEAARRLRGVGTRRRPSLRGPARGRTIGVLVSAGASEAGRRAVCAVCLPPLEGRGMGLSELQVFDRVTVTPWPGDVALPGEGLEKVLGAGD